MLFIWQILLFWDEMLLFWFTDQFLQIYIFYSKFNHKKWLNISELLWYSHFDHFYLTKTSEILTLLDVEILSFRGESQQKLKTRIGLYLGLEAVFDFFAFLLGALLANVLRHSLFRSGVVTNTVLYFLHTFTQVLHCFSLFWFVS